MHVRSPLSPRIFLGEGGGCGMHDLIMSSKCICDHHSPPPFLFFWGGGEEWSPRLMPISNRWYLVFGGGGMRGLMRVGCCASFAGTAEASGREFVDCTANVLHLHFRGPLHPLQPWEGCSCWCCGSSGEPPSPPPPGYALVDLNWRCVGHVDKNRLGMALCG